MKKINSKDNITNLSKEYLYVLNTTNNIIEDSIYVGYTGGFIAGGIVMDKNNKVWVLTSGKIGNNNNGRLTKINPINTCCHKAIFLNIK